MLLPSLEKQFEEKVTQHFAAWCKDGVQVQPHIHLQMALKERGFGLGSTICNLFCNLLHDKQLIFECSCTPGEDGSCLQAVELPALLWHLYALEWSCPWLDTEGFECCWFILLKVRLPASQSMMEKSLLLVYYLLICRIILFYLFNSFYFILFIYFLIPSEKLEKQLNV